MNEIQSFLTEDHRLCDDIFVQFENRLADDDWSELVRLWSQFAEQLRTHFTMEEEVLFPAFESATGMRSGPTAVMRGQHEQMRLLLSEMDAAVAAQDSEQCEGAAETLMIMMQQHNMSEEQVLYPMTDQELSSADTVALMRKYAI